jgi:hypothetical protein
MAAAYFEVSHPSGFDLAELEEERRDIARPETYAVCWVC